MYHDDNHDICDCLHELNDYLCVSLIYITIPQIITRMSMIDIVTFKAVIMIPRTFAIISVSVIILSITVVMLPLIATIIHFFSATMITIQYSKRDHPRD